MKLFNKKSLFILFSVFSIIGYSFVVFAAAPNGGYTPGTTLDPDCAPGDTDCIVALTTGGSSQWNDVVGGINYAGGNVGIGTTTPSAALDVIGTIQGSNLNITGDGITTAAPTNISVSFIYDPGYNYGAYGLPHNYRVYSYKDTVQGRVYSPSYLTISSPSEPVPAAPTNLVANQTCTDGCNYYADGSVPQNFRVYSYKFINDQRIYSTSYATLVSNFIDDNSNSSYDVTLSWDPVVGADGYRILKYDQNYNNYNYDAGYDTTATSIVDDGCGNLCYDSGKSSATTTNDIFDDNSTNQYGIEVSWDPVVGADGYRVLIYDPNYNGYNYDAGYDTTATSFIDDACGSICFDSGLSNVGQTSVYTNVATINGQLTLTGPIIMQGSPIRLDQNRNFGVISDISTLIGTDNVFFGDGAGNGVTTITNSNFLGQNAGSGATDARFSNFSGQGAGFNAVNASFSNFFGPSAGYEATNAGNSNFFGDGAGRDATEASSSNFFGNGAGRDAISAANSNFFGNYAGRDATYASNSNFLGAYAGYLAVNASSANFLGFEAGYGATNATNSNFFGPSAGKDAVFASNSNFMGLNTGQDATNASSSNFIGSNAGNGATSSFQSNFIGVNAGRDASSAPYSNFIGVNAGYNASNANNSNFFGNTAGSGATDASNSNFFGVSAGESATNADHSNFLGNGAGYTAANATQSNFLGSNAGSIAINASNSNFFGNNAGYSATNADSSNFFGQSAGVSATYANNSNFIGQNAGSGATYASNSNFFGTNAGQNATVATDSNFFGRNAGYAVSNSQNNFFGLYAGYQATGATNSNFFGAYAGYQATNANSNNFFGPNAGNGATNASASNFFGPNAGFGATSVSNSNFFGDTAGSGATNAQRSNFFGLSAGSGAINASNSIFIGSAAGLNDTVNNNTNGADYSILIGFNTSTNGFKNSIALGGLAANTASNQFTVGSTIRPITQMFVQGSGNTCTLTTGTGWSCSSDERLKKNITDLNTDTLDKVLSLKTVTYNWISGDVTSPQIGFLAQDLEQQFPELVTTDPTGYKSVYYAQMTPILVEAIREMNLKITAINDMDTPNTWRDSLIAWFGNVGNGITELFVGRVRTHELCLDDVCVTKDQLQQLLQNSQQTIVPSSSGNPPTDPDPEITPDDTVPSDSDPIENPDDSGDSNSDTPADDVPTE